MYPEVFRSVGVKGRESSVRRAAIVPGGSVGGISERGDFDEFGWEGFGRVDGGCPSSGFRCVTEVDWWVGIDVLGWLDGCVA